MAKLRIYELARELGLENKALLDLCEKLGIDGKSSHSNTLSDDEADQIRRSVIRRALSDKNSGLVRESTKGGQLITEKRVGDVIRRRRKAVGPGESVEDEQSGDQAQIHSSGYSEVGAEEEIGTDTTFQGEHDLSSDEAGIASHQVISRELGDAKTGGTDLETSSENHLARDRVPSEESTRGIERDTDSVVKHAKVSLPNAGSETGVEPNETEVASSAEEEVLSGEGSALEQRSEESVDSSLAAGRMFAPSEIEELRKKHDIRTPKVLGRIELPVVVKAKAPVFDTKEKGSVEQSKGSETKTSQARQGKGEHKGQAKGSGGNTEEASASGKARAGKKDREKRKSDHIEDDESLLRKPRKKQVLRQADLLDYETDRETWKLRKDKKKKGGEPAAGGAVAGPTKASKKVIKVDAEISVGELARQMGVKSGDLIKKLMGLGTLANVNQLIDFDTATLLATEFDFTTVNVGGQEEDMIAEAKRADSPDVLRTRPPVVTVMGHVDHGKTSLLDAIRKTSITKQEAGGITQHIGAYIVQTQTGGSVTFIDTPGHEAFTAMRSRGAKVTDIVVLVVAADDGVMPQTIEAINHAKAAQVPLIVAINKMDKEQANPDRVKTQLAEHGLIPEDWGGDTIMVPVSAHSGHGLDLLLENLLLQAEVLELRANPERAAVGTVIESAIDRGRGPVMTVLIQNGTLKKGDTFIVGATYGRVKALYSDCGEPIESAGPGVPAEILGSDEVPLAGDDFIVLSSESEARDIAADRARKLRMRDLSTKAGVQAIPLTLENFADFVSGNEIKELPLIVKADYQGSVEAVSQALERLTNEEIKVRLVHRGVGSVTENDVQLGVASKALIVAFNVRAEVRAQQMAEQDGVRIIYSRIIYELVEEIQDALKGMRAPEFKETTLGRVEVREVFRLPRIGVVAGSYVLDGNVERGASVRLLRDNRVIFEGKMASLRRFKDDVREVSAGYECGIGLEGYQDIRGGDVLEVYKMEQVKH